MTSFDERAQAWDDDPVKVERAYTIADAIRQAVPWRPGMRALEFGAGTGLAGFRLLPELGALTLADTSEGMLDVVRKKIARYGLSQAQALYLDLDLGLPETRFDLIFSLMTLHHLPDAGQALKDFHTLLAGPGYLCIADLDREDGSFHGPAVTDVHHGFDRSALAELAEAAGFTRVRFSTVYVMRKPVGEGWRHYPVFLMVAEKT